MHVDKRKMGERSKGIKRVPSTIENITWFLLYQTLEILNANTCKNAIHNVIWRPWITFFGKMCHSENKCRYITLWDGIQWIVCGILHFGGDFWPPFETINIQVLRGFSIHRILERLPQDAQRNLSVMIKRWKCFKITANSTWWQIFNFPQQAPTCQIKEAGNQHKPSLLAFTTWRNKTTNISWQTIRTIFQQLQAKIGMHQACSKINWTELSFCDQNSA